jgi:hypothetical protein
MLPIGDDEDGFSQALGGPCGTSPMTPKSVWSSDTHIRLWDTPDETLLIVDWDDSLFPTTSVGSRVGAAWRQVESGSGWAESAEFKAYAEVVIDFLRAASTIAHIRIVTMATNDWIQLCFSRLMPDFSAFLAELGIEIVIARDFLTHRVKAQVASDGNCRDMSQFLKTQAIDKVIKEFYNTPRPDGPAKKRSWKNIMGIGDSSAERLALQDVAFRHQQRSHSGRWKDYRYKTLMLLDQPSIEELTQEIGVLKRWLPELLSHDGDLDIDIDRGNMALNLKGDEGLRLSAEVDSLEKVVLGG